LACAVSKHGEKRAAPICAFSVASALRIPPAGGLVVDIQSTTITIQELRIERPTILDYLRTVAPEKQEIALIHALEVGVLELAVRRERFQR
jgi:hypothetical protein